MLSLSVQGYKSTYLKRISNQDVEQGQQKAPSLAMFLALEVT